VGRGHKERFRRNQKYILRGSRDWEEVIKKDLKEIRCILRGSREWEEAMYTSWE
jgi:hypothetical protein